mmetsp:Transcript_74580/g.212604  ORF Transcript_74580/g.212604 Transcript_74580/m.212604 type:complete len:231 (+) Transcript_74580:85-777(+)
MRASKAAMLSSISVWSTLPTSMVLSQSLGSTASISSSSRSSSSAAISSTSASIWFSLSSPISPPTPAAALPSSEYTGAMPVRRLGRSWLYSSPSASSARRIWLPLLLAPMSVTATLTTSPCLSSPGESVSTTPCTLEARFTEMLTMPFLPWGGSTDVTVPFLVAPTTKPRACCLASSFFSLSSLALPLDQLESRVTVNLPLCLRTSLIHTSSSMPRFINETESFSLPSRT